MRSNICVNMMEIISHAASMPGAVLAAVTHLLIESATASPTGF